MSVFLIALNASGRAGGTARMLGVALETSRVRNLPWLGRSEPTGLALIFLLLHRAHASCDRRSRRGSLVPATSGLSAADFLRLRTALPFAPGCWPSCCGVNGDPCACGCECWSCCCCCWSMAMADDIVDAMLRSGRAGWDMMRDSRPTTSRARGRDRGLISTCLRIQLCLHKGLL